MNTLAIRLKTDSTILESHVRDQNSEYYQDNEQHVFNVWTKHNIVRCCNILTPSTDIEIYYKIRQADLYDNTQL